MAYIKCRKKLPEENEQYNLCRRLEEYIEFAHATQSFSNVSFYEELLEYIDKEKTE